MDAQGSANAAAELKAVDMNSMSTTSLGSAVQAATAKAAGAAPSSAGLSPVSTQGGASPISAGESYVRVEMDEASPHSMMEQHVANIKHDLKPTQLEEMVEEYVHDATALARLRRLQFWFDPFVAAREAITMFFRFALLTDLMLVAQRLDGIEWYVAAALLFSIASQAMLAAFEKNVDRHISFIRHASQHPTEIDRLIESDFQKLPTIVRIVKTLSSLSETAMVVIMLLLFSSATDEPWIGLVYQGTPSILLASAITEIIRLCTKGLIVVAILSYVRPPLSGIRKGLFGF